MESAPQKPTRSTSPALMIGLVLLLLFLAYRTSIDDADQLSEPAGSQPSPTSAASASEVSELESVSAQEETESASPQGEDESDVTTAEEGSEAASPGVEPGGAAFSDGIWTVGRDIQPGTYTTTEVVSDRCFWTIYVTGTNTDDIVVLDSPSGGRPTVTLTEGQDFDTSRCGDWAPEDTVDLPSPGEPADVFDGIWTVGRDIAPGTYTTEDAVGDRCFWVIYDTGTNTDDIVTLDSPSGGRPTVTIAQGQDFDTSRCGTWVPAE